ncbi:hypothetical protein PAXRUDRAFT_825946 [Paxillus rubicundulus Ve08.2h10]|uniref:Uncharacterized protein n=1 Tax=Paxillus rubicundulus Ve08.2h10 TaxID=930991 RepID=A0A0D0DSK7_9AGAM|nr:hypothetical protein PAXRUDRAFT_825946 [Paxillus rubicundulus Ve08.2h10]
MQYLRSSLFAVNHDNPASVSAFTSNLITIVHSVGNIQSLQLDNLDSNQTEALASALCDLRELHTFTTGRASPRHLSDDGVISIVQLAHCLASWPSLKSLTIHGAQPHTTTELVTALRLPVCALAELITDPVFITDNELMYLMATSLRTLERVTFDSIDGITNVGLRRLLDAISKKCVLPHNPTHGSPAGCQRARRTST